MSFKHGDHACLIYSTHEELAEIIADFITEGFRRGERCWYVASGTETPLILEALKHRRVDAAAQTRKGALALMASNGAYGVQNGFEPEQSMRVFSDAIEQALRDGFTGFRAAAEMSWALQSNETTERLIVYEALLRSLFSTARATGLCLYPRREMPLSVINGALHTHPVVGVNGRFQPNPFYDPKFSGLTKAVNSGVRSRLQQLASSAKAHPAKSRRRVTLPE